MARYRFKRSKASETPQFNKHNLINQMVNDIVRDVDSYLSNTFDSLLERQRTLYGPDSGLMIDKSISIGQTLEGRLKAPHPEIKTECTGLAKQMKQLRIDMRFLQDFLASFLLKFHEPVQIAVVLPDELMSIPSLSPYTVERARLIEQFGQPTCDKGMFYQDFIKLVAKYRAWGAMCRGL